MASISGNLVVEPVSKRYANPDLSNEDVVIEYELTHDDGVFALDPPTRWYSNLEICDSRSYTLIGDENEFIIRAREIEHRVPIQEIWEYLSGINFKSGVFFEREFDFNGVIIRINWTIIPAIYPKPEMMEIDIPEQNRLAETSWKYEYLDVSGNQREEQLPYRGTYDGHEGGELVAYDDKGKPLGRMSLDIWRNWHQGDDTPTSFRKESKTNQGISRLSIIPRENIADATTQNLEAKTKLNLKLYNKGDKEWDPDVKDSARFLPSQSASYTSSSSSSKSSSSKVSHPPPQIAVRGADSWSSTSGGKLGEKDKSSSSSSSSTSKKSLTSKSSVASKKTTSASTASTSSESEMSGDLEDLREDVLECLDYSIGLAEEGLKTFQLEFEKCREATMSPNVVFPTLQEAKNCLNNLADNAQELISLKKGIDEQHSNSIDSLNNIKNRCLRLMQKNIGNMQNGLEQTDATYCHAAHNLNRLSKNYIRESKELFAGIEHEISSHKVPRISSGLKQILDKADELAENCEREVQLLRQKALATKATLKGRKKAEEKIILDNDFAEVLVHKEQALDYLEELRKLRVQTPKAISRDMHKREKKARLKDYARQYKQLYEDNAVSQRRTENFRKDMEREINQLHHHNRYHHREAINDHDYFALEYTRHHSHDKNTAMRHNLRAIQDVVITNELKSNQVK